MAVWGVGGESVGATPKQGRFELCALLLLENEIRSAEHAARSPLS